MFTSTRLKQLSMVTVVSSFITLGIGGAVQASTLTFDELSTTPIPGSRSPGGGAVPNGYQGLNFNNLFYVNGATTASISGGAGYGNGTVSGSNVAYNGFGNPAIVSTSTGTFDFNSAYLTASFDDSLNVLVEGFSGGVSKYSETVAVNTHAATLFNFDFLGIDQLVFSSKPGGGGKQFALDNATFNETQTVPSQNVPEPMTVCGTLLAGGMGVLMKKKQATLKKAKQTAKV